MPTHTEKNISLRRRFARSGAERQSKNRVPPTAALFPIAGMVPNTPVVTLGAFEPEKAELNSDCAHVLWTRVSPEARVHLSAAVQRAHPLALPDPPKRPALIKIHQRTRIQHSLILALHKLHTCLDQIQPTCGTIHTTTPQSCH
jgi:hypothetical protein